ncbi:hypothetical protein SHKM778_27080 [Streptomyces sp. KM77-8]|uniref:Uncharacterized protein n=1 Tax=Streptomyces haneummycinicus TaxID=3074435 RepID=A0AAT9HGM5_9ACTN
MTHMSADTTVVEKTVWRAQGSARRSTHTLRLYVSAGLVAVTALAVLLVPPLVQLDQQAVDLAAKLLPPSWSHPSAPTTSAATCCCAASTGSGCPCWWAWWPRSPPP